MSAKLSGSMAGKTHLSSPVCSSDRSFCPDLCLFKPGHAPLGDYTSCKTYRWRCN